MIPINYPLLREGVSSEKETVARLNAVVAFLNKFRSGKVTFDPGLIAAGTVLDTTFAVADSVDMTGLAVGMAIYVTPPALLTAGLDVECLVPAANKLTIRLKNGTGAGIDAPSGVWAFMGCLVG